MLVRSDIEILSKMNLIDYLTNDDVYPANDSSLLPDDVWEKFECEHLPDLDDIIGDIPAVDENNVEINTIKIKEEAKEIRNHDCMWAGHCASKEHPADEPRHNVSCFGPIPPELFVQYPRLTEVKQEFRTFWNGQQSLLKPTVRAAAMPQTPPMSDDEESKSKTMSVLKLLNEHIASCDLEEDSDLCDYFEEKDIKEEIDISEPDIETTKPSIQFQQCAAESDHSYHKGKSNLSQIACFGIDTPSDSEEEIDVVNVNDKFQFINRSVFAFPNKPSSRDRHQIQRRMETAITKKRMPMPQGIKTLMPVKKMAQQEPTPAKKKQMTPKKKQYRPTPTSPYKRRHCGNSSDSEQEPSEKRNLHNNMERQRRIDLRNAFEDLRVLVPEVCKKERAAKVVILREAAQYCRLLTNSSSNNNKQLEDLKKHQEFLRRRVSSLRKNLAANR